MNYLQISVLFFCTIIIFSLFITSCTKDDPTSPPPLALPPSTTGSCSGTLTEGNISGTFLINVLQDVISFRGNGTLGTLSITVTGENHYPDISFSCGAAGYQPFTFAGKFTSPTELSGLVNGSGFTNAVVVLTKN